VRVIGDAASGYTVHWRDNSNDETHFEILVSVWNDDLSVSGRAVGRADANATAVAMLPLEPPAPPDGCYTATIYVFSARAQSASGLPGNTATTLCSNAGIITLPAAGGGPAQAHDPLLMLAIAMLAAGGISAFAGAVIRRA
jgi:hypothetical protein